MVPCAAIQNSVQARACPESGPTGCRFPLSCPPPSLPFLPFLPGMQPGDPLPDCKAEADQKRVETQCSWRISIARTGHEYAAGLRLLIDGNGQRNGCTDVVRRLIGHRRIVAGLRNEERSFAPIRWWRRHDRRHIRRSRKPKNRCERGDICACFCGQSASCRQMLIIAPGTGIVGCEHGRDIAIAVPHLPQIRRTCEDVVARIVRIAPEAMAAAQACPGIGHDLHQSHCTR